MNKITNLLKGNTRESKIAFDNLKTKLGKEYSSCWYPSSASDFGLINEIERSGWKPDLFIFTDYALDAHHFDFDLGENSTLNWEYTYGKIIESNPIDFKTAINYDVNPDYVGLPEFARDETFILLLKIELWHKDTEQLLSTNDVLYFNFENINFLDEVLLKNKVQMEYFLKTNEGMGYGGGKRSVKGVYGLFSELGVKHLLTDRYENHGDVKIFKEMKTKHNLIPKCYTLNGLESRARNDRGTCYDVEYNEAPFEVEYLEKLFTKY